MGPFGDQSRKMAKAKFWAAALPLAWRGTAQMGLAGWRTDQYKYLENFCWVNQQLEPLEGERKSSWFTYNSMHLKIMHS